MHAFAVRAGLRFHLPVTARQRAATTKLSVRRAATVRSSSARFCGECGTALEGATTASSAGLEPGEVEAPPSAVTSVTALAHGPTQIDGSDNPLQRSPELAAASRARLHIVEEVAPRLGTRGRDSGAGHSGRSDRCSPCDPWRRQEQANDTSGHDLLSLANGALGRLATANRQAQADLAQTLSPDSAAQLNQDGAAIVSYADGSAAQLRRLARPSAEQVAHSQVLLTFVAANRAYGTTIQEYAEQSVDIAALQSSAAAIANAVRAADAQLPPAARLPSPTVFDVSATGATGADPHADFGDDKPGSDSQVDLRLRSRLFFGRSKSDARSGDGVRPKRRQRQDSSAAAIAEAERFTALRRQSLASALRLEAPAGYARAQALLVQSLRLSIADDEALMLWARARQRGANPQTFLDRANAIGAQATAAKKRFLALYGPLRRASTGKPASRLPDGY